MKRSMTPLLMTAMMITTGCTQGNGNDNIARDTTIAYTESSEQYTQTVTETASPADDIPEEAASFLSSLRREGDIWYNEDERYTEIVEVLKKQYDSADGIHGIYAAADDENIIFAANLHSFERDGVTKANPFTTYEAGSITKMFTASVVLQLCEQGKLSLDDRLGRFWPEYTYGADITIYQLLHMQSGIYDLDHKMSEFMPEDAPEEMKARAEKGELTDDEFLQLVFAKELKFEPGSKYEYSNTNYKLLALIVEELTGQSFAEYVRENVFDRCGMTHSSIAAQGDVTSVPGDTENPYCTYTYFIRGAGDLHTCPADLLAFDRELFAGKILNDDSLDEMFNMDKSYGCGWYIEKAFPQHYFHGGDVGNYISLNAAYNAGEDSRIYLVAFFPDNNRDTSRTMYGIFDSVRLALDY